MYSLKSCAWLDEKKTILFSVATEKSNYEVHVHVKVLMLFISQSPFTVFKRVIFIVVTMLQICCLCLSQLPGSDDIYIDIPLSIPP